MQVLTRILELTYWDCGFTPRDSKEDMNTHTVARQKTIGLALWFGVLQLMRAPGRMFLSPPETLNSSQRCLPQPTRPSQSEDVCIPPSWPHFHLISPLSEQLFIVNERAFGWQQQQASYQPSHQAAFYSASSSIVNVTTENGEALCVLWLLADSHTWFVSQDPLEVSAHWFLFSILLKPQ